MPTIDALLEDLEVDAPVSQVLMGAFWTAVVLGGECLRCGLASTLRGETDHHGPPVPEAGDLLRYSGRELAGWLSSPSKLKASIGLAAFNALSTVDTDACDELNAERVILERGVGRRVAIVGHFPFVERVRQAAETCWVLELRPRPGDLPAEQADEVLPQADVVALTSTSLINHTFENLIGLCHPDSFVVMLGPSTPFSTVMFEAGIDALSGTVVIEPGRVLRSIAQGATFRQVKQAGGLRLLTVTRKTAHAID